MRRLVPALMCLALLSSCADGLQFTGDHRLKIQTPRDRARVEVPFEVRWTMQGDDEYVFAVFVDRTPMPVGKSLRWLARNDDGCERDPRCPDEAYLRERNVYLTTGNSVTVPVLPRAAAGVGDERHDVTVVLLDEKGVRRTESAWYRNVRSERKQR